MDKLQELSELGTVFYDLSEAALRRKLNVSMKPDTCISLHPYFEVHEGKMDHANEL